MAFHSYIPQPPLSGFVEMLWLYGGYTQPHAKERLLPSGVMQLVINLNVDSTRIYDRRDTDQFRTYRQGVFSGAHSEFHVIDTASQASVIGVHFKPGGAFPFFKMPAGELQEEIIGLDALWGRKAAELREQLLAAETPTAKFLILEQSLIGQAIRPLTRHRAVAFALKEFRKGPQSSSILEITEQIGLSPRRFSQIFSDEVGLTPKLFCRILRFQEALQRIASGERIEWTALALDCGYFDQAHFNHDFRAFSGLTPTTYLTCRSEHLNHVALFD